MLSPHADDPDSRAHQRKREILEAASRAFRRQGLHATGMRDIAQESDMHVGNLYYYFHSKQELLAFCQERTLESLIELAELHRDLQGPVDERLRQLITGHVVLLNEELPGSLAHLEVEALESPWKEQIVEQRDRYEAILAELLEEGMRSGLLRPAEIGITVKAILGAVNWTVKWYRPRGPLSSREIGAEIAGLVVHGLIAPGIEKRTSEAHDAADTPPSRPAGEGHA